MTTVICIAFVSNTTKDRVARFIGHRNIPAFPEAGKPRTRCFKAASEAIGCADGGAAVLGDQLLTDSLAAHRAGLRAIIVPPIKDKTSAFFRLKRLIEAPYVRKYFRENGDCGISESVWHKKKRRS